MMSMKSEKFQRIEVESVRAFRVTSNGRNFGIFVCDSEWNGLMKLQAYKPDISSNMVIHPSRDAAVDFFRSLIRTDEEGKREVTVVMSDQELMDELVKKEPEGEEVKE